MKETSNMSSKEYFDKVANDWDTMRTEFFPESVRDTAYNAAEIRPGQIAADIGAGTGFLTEGLLRRGAKVIAVDQSQAMIDHMKNKFGADGTVEYYLGDASALPVPDNSIDAAFANMYLHHVESPPEAIKEMTRILKPGGVLVITDLDKHNYEFLVTEQHDRWMGFERADVVTWFKDAGLEGAHIDCVGDKCCAASSTKDEAAQVSIFIATGRRA
jgi:ubiquinone/menaquinone biosynthesis C-methylase UbiE